jgi:hypothetical protein
MTGTLIANAAALLGLLFQLTALVLFLDWAVHHLPGAAWNPLRRTLFRAVQPFLSWSGRSFSVQWGAFDSRGLFTAILLLAAARWGIPWLILLGHSLRG